MPTPNGGAVRTGHPLGAVVFWLLTALFVFLPLFRAGATPLAAIISQLLSLAVLVAVFWAPRDVPLSRKEVLAIAGLVFLPLIFLIPLPADLVSALPGRGIYRDAQALLQTDARNVWRAASVYPLATAQAATALLLPVAVFIGVRTLDPRRLVVLAHLLIGIAVLQGLLGVVQFQTAQTGEKLFHIAGSHGDSGTGTYANRNHLAGLIEMTLPLALALFFYTLAGGSQGFGSGSGWKRRILFLGNRQGNVALAYGGIALLLILGVVFSRSRAGISLSILGILLSTFLFARRVGRHGVFGPAGTIAVIAVAVALAIGLAPVLERFSVEDAVNDLRFVVFAATIGGIATLFPVGSGPGTYPEAFLAFQPIETGHKWVNRAHNDYLEWIFDGGVVAILLIGVMLALFVYQWTRVYTREPWSQSRYLQVGAGIGLLLIALHEIVDYNLHTPANQLVFAFLAGIFFMPPSALEGMGGAASRPRSGGRSARLAASETADVPSPARSDPIPPNQIENPFRNPKIDEEAGSPKRLGEQPQPPSA